MKLHLPSIIKWLNNCSAIEQCHVCHSFNLEVLKKGASAGVDRGKSCIYLCCDCNTVPKLLLAKMKIEDCSNTDLKDLLFEWINTKKAHWNKVVRYFAISTKNW